MDQDPLRKFLLCKVSTLRRNDMVFFKSSGVWQVTQIYEEVQGFRSIQFQSMSGTNAVKYKKWMTVSGNQHIMAYSPPLRKKKR